MRAALATIFILSTILAANATEGEYAVSKIPKSLFENANAIVRFDETRAELKGLDKIIIKNRFAITILNEGGDRFAEAFEFYDKLQTIDRFEGSLYDAFGNRLRILKKNEIRDVSATSQINFADDSRMKIHNFYFKSYPYTVEYEIEKVMKQSMFLPGWVPVNTTSLAVEYSTLIMIIPVDYRLRFKTYNYNGEPVVKELEGKKMFSWFLKDYKAIRSEYASPAAYRITPSVFLAPSEFQIEGYSGNMTDWKELGKFQYSLNRGLSELPGSLKTTVHGIVNELSTDKEKVVALYEFLQKNTRYVSIQLGIGGWRPFDATYVGTKGYGDCKALSNYMYALLKEAGIKSYYTLIKAGEYEEDIIVDFPSRQFNHAILCVPLLNDTIWLECTDQFKSPGYMGGFTGNRHALLITEEGGVLVATPRYGSKENLQERTIKAKLDGEGSLNAKVRTTYKCMQQDDLHLFINNLSKERVKNRLDQSLELPSYTINDFTYREVKGLQPEIEEDISLTVDHYAIMSGKRLFINPNIITRSKRKLNADQQREYELRFTFGYTDIDQVEIEIPENYKPESIPGDSFIESKFGIYKASVKLENNRIIYKRKIEHYYGTFPKSDYSELANFYDAIYKADRNRLVLIKTNDDEKKPF